MYRLDRLTGLIETKVLLNIGEKLNGFTGMVLLFYSGLFRVSTVRVHAYIAPRDFVELSDVSVSSFFHDIKFI
jgi:hypothetical protein